MSASRIFVVTGSNKGIGLATVKALCEAVGSESIVYLTARSVERGTKAVEDLAKSGLKPRFHPLDVDDASSIETFATFLKKEHGGLDVLVNNAAIAYKGNATEPFGVQAEHTIRVNYFGLQAVCKALFPLLRPHSRVVNVSSCVGHLTKVPGEELRKKLSDPTLTEDELDGIMHDFVKAAAENKHGELGWQNSAYGASKVGVSALTRIQQRMLDQDPRDDIVVNHCHPGYVDTDMTSHRGVLTVEQGAVCPTYLALLPPNVSSPRGEYLWYDKQVVDWVDASLPPPGY
ncbi:carbonyl reductase [NADPH] 1 [Hyalella azteca]|uniref:carbonyl reductase (NADPH) n=1 Tax=Hyalella azteca TaxID=294128 RepID=A0A8B7NIG8_HYAAZ|nr:carbonyl reductase [NADPH] 1 [Hyalella azteca]